MSGFPTESPEILPCPECAQGKHGNCDSSTWDEWADDYTICPCWAAAHRPQGDE